MAFYLFMWSIELGGLVLNLFGDALLGKHHSQQPQTNASNMPKEINRAHACNGAGPVFRNKGDHGVAQNLRRTLTTDKPKEYFQHTKLGAKKKKQ